MNKSISPSKRSDRRWKGGPMTINDYHIPGREDERAPLTPPTLLKVRLWGHREAEVLRWVCVAAIFTELRTMRYWIGSQRQSPVNKQKSDTSRQLGIESGEKERVQQYKPWTLTAGQTGYKAEGGSIVWISRSGKTRTSWRPLSKFLLHCFCL